MKTYLVGGAVRDYLLGLPVKDRDWVVVGADAQTMLAQGFQPVGKDFPVFLHPDTHEEYALARTERKTAKGYAGFSFHADKDVTLEQDLMRRDLTINAMAQDSDGLIDPFGGQQDLAAGILRHVSPAFAEDPVRILRTARFAARYGFEIAEETMRLMRQMVENGEADALVAERVWQELAKGLMEKNPRRMIEVLRECGALKVLLPEVDALFGVPQRADYHPEIDSGIHTLMTLQRAADMDLSLPERYAALLHDLGKAKTPPDILPKHHGHDLNGVEPVREVNLPLAHHVPPSRAAQKQNHSEGFAKNRRLPPPRTFRRRPERLHCRYARPSEPRTHALPPARALARPTRSRQSGGFGQNRRRMPRAGKSPPHCRTNRPRTAGTDCPAAKSVSTRFGRPQPLLIRR